MEFMGYKRSDGGVGVRNYLAIIPSVFCAACTAEKIAAQVPGAIVLRHAVGCTQVGLDFELTARTLCNMGTHPNVGGVLIIGLGCERFQPTEFYDAVKASGRPVDMLIIQDEGGTTNTIKKGIELGLKLKAQVNNLKREACDIRNLTIATKCGGTDATSGLAANPVVGNMVDKLIDENGSAILSELNELIGTEDMLAKRAVNEQVKCKIYAAVSEIENLLKHSIDLSLGEKRNQLISPGNFAGGVSSIVEKALGGVHKGGTRPIVDVLEYAVKPEADKHGLFLMNYESQDGEVVTGMIACGAQIVAFTSGRGNPTGHPIAPVIKITGNRKVYEHMQENFDFDASGVISTGQTIDELGDELLAMVLDIANGKQTVSEEMGGNELFCIGRRHGYHKPEYCPENC